MSWPMWYLISLRRSAVLVGTPVLLVLVVLLLSSDPPQVDNYWVAATSGVASTVFPIAWICAVCAAWEAGRLRRAGVSSWAPARSALRLALATVAPVLIMGGVGLVAAAALIFPDAAGAPGLPDVRPLLVAVAVIVAHTLVGYALGWRLSPYAAVPLALAGSYLWLAYPAAMEPLWLRHLVGGRNLTACCTPDQVPDVGALLAPVLTSAGLVGAVALLVAERPRLRSDVAAAVVLAAGIAAAVPLVDDLGADPVRPRSANALICDTAGVRVCVWPEHRSRIADVRRAAEQLAGRLAAVGIPAPTTVTEDTHAASPQVWSLSMLVDADAEQITGNLVEGMLPAAPPTCAQDGEFAGADAYEPVNIWLHAAAGLELDNPYEVSPQDRKIVTAVRKLPAAKQHTWFERNRAALSDCRIHPQLAVGGMR